MFLRDAGALPGAPALTVAWKANAKFPPGSSRPTLHVTMRVAALYAHTPFGLTVNATKSRPEGSGSATTRFVAASVGVPKSGSLGSRVTGFGTVVGYVTPAPAFAVRGPHALVMCWLGARISVSNAIPPKKYVSPIVPRQTAAPVAPL